MKKEKAAKTSCAAFFVPTVAFETLRAEPELGCICPALHLARLSSSAALLNIASPPIHEVRIFLNQYTPKTLERVKITWDGTIWKAHAQPLVELPAASYKKGVQTDLMQASRLIPNAKYESPLYQKREENKEPGTWERLIQNNNGIITEGSLTNILCIKEGIVFMNTETALNGIMQQRIQTILLEQGYEIYETNGFSYNFLQEAEAIALTNSLRGIVPVRSFQTTIYKTHPLIAHLVQLWQHKKV